MSTLSVSVRDEGVSFPTYLPAAPDRNPMFLEKRVYQGSSGRVYPLPFIDRIEEEPVAHEWRAITVENEFIEVMILPEIGGRIHRLRDKTNDYDAVYYQPVIKPALVGLAGPWISGGIEFNWPQHHRPSTFMPAQVEIERHPDGAVTVWLSEHEPMERMKGMHGVCLRPGRSVLELCARVYNRTSDVQTFLWWANMANEVHEHYQSFFPADATFVADHAKRAMSRFPLCDGHYYGVDYASRAKNGVPESECPRQFVPDGSYPPNDLSWYANIPVPTSYMCMGTQEGFFGGYDHRTGAGIVHVADPHISPGKKQWTWGNHEFGYAWDRQLTDADAHGVRRPYIELMAGVYSDNQPDFSYLQPAETKSWTQSWYPLRAIGPADQANADAAVSLRVSGQKVRVGVDVTAFFADSRISLTHGGQTLTEFDRDLSPATPLVEEVHLPRQIDFRELVLTIEAGGRLLMRYQPLVPPAPPTPDELAALAATEPPAPAEIANADELYITGVHLEQYRHATRCPAAYWREALRRDEGDARCNLALGRWYLRRGEFADAERHLRASIARQTLRNPNPTDGEAFYQLGRVLRFLGCQAEAYGAFYKATWNQAWASAGYHRLAEIDCMREEWATALEHIERSLCLNTENSCAVALKALVLQHLNRTGESNDLVHQALRLDCLDPWLRQLAGLPWCGDNHIRLDVAFDLARAGFVKQALEILEGADTHACDGSLPMIAYVRAWLHEQVGEAAEAAACRRIAQQANPDYCFPSRLEEMLVLQQAVAAEPDDSHAHLYLGHLLYDRRRHREAIAHWEATVGHDPAQAIAWRCLGIAYFNIEHDPAKASTAFAHALNCAPDDARLFFESDQLAKRIGEPPETRLGLLEEHMALVQERDDLTVELCALYNQCGQPRQAQALLASRRFQPWEGGEGQALGQHVRTQLLLGREALEQHNPAQAIRHFESALVAPENLGEAKHLLANQSDIYFWLGEVRAAAGDASGAERAWQTAAAFKGDFQDMSVRTFSEMSYFSALAMRRLGQEENADQLLKKLLAYARTLEHEAAKIDYFVTSLPTMLLFEEDIQARQVTSARFLQAQALLGRGYYEEARQLLDNVLTRDPNHALAADLLGTMPRADTINS